ncbi:ribonuclease BN (tRNA processing enzyme) [Anaerobacterium chartisolvens]|uniref:Ribonuclease BN (tRNA processing enzyme) n=1 Tax=Anaerobacterium chartisolvens TaxID=1297424 RepID=A0A369AWD6_9FIRM|nr:MBL fold metallo-hydrolase [Anaerobacterium chartisolvens]RCX13481.1 ribonuclease BN (tRNA processing enzyme) [Anaerobacterium chartisolvens]
MKLTVLGNNGPFPGAGGACSGYLIQEGGVNILLDCGNGVLGNLQKFISLKELDAIILTHLHSDHISDMMVLRYWVQIKKNRGEINSPIKVFAPNEPADELARLDIKGIFELETVSEDTELSFGGLDITFSPMKHPIKCYAVSIKNESRHFVFSGDTAWNTNIIDFSKNADVIMLDSGLLARDKASNDVPHLTAGECGLVAAQAGAKRLLLTHFWPEYDLNELLEEAKQSFQNTQLAQLLGVYEI